METIALYWEPKIKTYGFQVVKDLTMCEYLIPLHLLVDWDRVLEGIAIAPRQFHLLCGQLNKGSELSLLVLSNPDQARAFNRPMQELFPEAEGCRSRVITPVELLFFQGPHYGDRYGIADFTYQALKSHADSLLATVFSCASVYLVLPEGSADGVRDRLTATFNIPG